MKKILWGLALSVMVLQGCKKDEDDTASTTVAAENTTQQNEWDDTAIAKFLDEHYFDAKGNVVAFSDTDDTDNNEKKLSSYDLQKLPSGVIIIKRADSLQPNPGKTIASDDAIKIMQNTTSYIALKSTETGVVSLTSDVTFSNTILGTGVPVYDPSYYYAKQSMIDKLNTTNSTSYDRTYYEIEGLREGLSYFKSFDLDDSADYNMQGVIIVPSRAAFARDAHYAYGNYSWKDRTFVFDFQIYNTVPRSVAGN
jgi:hypothetical protein